MLRRSEARDYTQGLSAMLEAHRRDEASANLAGWNAFADHLHAREPAATLRDIASGLGPRASDFVTAGRRRNRPSVRAGLQISADLTFELTSSNIEAMGRYYVDKKPRVAMLGPNGDSDYANHYASNLISFVAQRHRRFNPRRPGLPAQPMIINLANLGLDHRLLEQNGIELHDPAPVPYLDQSTEPPSAGEFRDTKTTQLKPSIVYRLPYKDVQEVHAISLARAGFARPANDAVRQRLSHQLSSDLGAASFAVIPGFNDLRAHTLQR